MQRLTDRHSTPVTIRALRFAAIQLGRRPETQPLVGDLAAVRHTLQETTEVWLQAREERVAASALVRYLDSRVDRGVTRIARRVVDMVDGDRSDPRYIKLFPSAPHELTRSDAGEEQTRFVGTLLRTIREDPAYDGLIGLANELAMAQQVLDEALTSRKALYIDESTAASERRVALDAAQRAYNLTYPRLQLLFPGDDALVESFFLTISAGPSARASASELDAPSLAPNLSIDGPVEDVEV